MIKAERIRAEIVRLVKNGRNELTSAEIHTNLGLANRHVNVCAVMRRADALAPFGVEILETIGKDGETFVAKYKVIHSR